MLNRGSLSHSILESASDAVISVDADGTVVGWNRAAQDLFGFLATEVAGSPITAIIPGLSPSELVACGAGALELSGVSKGSKKFDIELSVSSCLHEDRTYFTLIARDASARKERDEFIREALRMAKSPTRREYLDAVVQMIQRWSGCSCVGIRILDEEGNMPFESYIGFDRAFWQWENWLSTKNDTCICTRIITGGIEPQDGPITTENGSFRTDNMHNFLATLSPEQLSRFRGNCPKFGYLTITFIPIQYRDQVLGGIHITDEREGMMPLRKVQFVESIATHIGEAIYRLSVEEALRSSERRYRHLFEESPVAVLEADFSTVRARLEQIRGRGVTDLRDYFDGNRAELSLLASSVAIRSVNKAALALYEADGVEEVIAHHTGIDAPFTVLVEEVIAFFQSGRQLNEERCHRTLKGNTRHVIVRFSTGSADAQGWSKVIVTLDDVSERKKAIEAMERFNDELVEKVRERTRDLEQARRAAELLSSLDGLTGIANRREFELVYDHEWRRGLRSGRPLSIIILDVDFFKLYNDNYGHLAGDLCLKKIALALKGGLKRAGDLAARFGGEEFVCVLPDTDAESALLIASHLQELVTALAIPHQHSTVHPCITVSIGVSTAVPEPGDLPAGLLGRADDMLYAAKRQGRNRVVAWP